MHIKSDVLIVGSGVAGMYAALNLDKNLKISLLTKGKLNQCNTYLAQGGIAVLKDDNDFELYLEDTLRAGEYKNNIEAVKEMIKNSRENINEIIKMGANFERDEYGNLKYTKEAAHSTKRILYSGDTTGKEIFETVYKEILKRDNISIYEDYNLIDIIEKDNQFCAGVAFYKEKQYFFDAKVAIFATGGIGGIFRQTTNQRILKGTGIAIALRHNVNLKDIGYIQIHPTALYEKKENNNNFLISEAVRGEGGKLVNIKGERFTDELLPRNVLSENISKEKERTNSEYVYLDLSAMGTEFIKERFPGIYGECKSRGIDITISNIPVTPVQHYFMGGIEVDLNSKTSMKGLYACGEVSCTGVHGANRLASNSLLEALVFSKKAAEEINEIIKNKDFISYNDNIKYDEKSFEDENTKLVLNEILKTRKDLENELLNR